MANRRSISSIGVVIAALVCVVTLTVPAIAAPPAVNGKMTSAERIYFEKKIRPILVKHCYSCHSTKAKKLGGKLLLDSRDAILKGGESGPALVAGDPGKSLIINALRHDDVEMPPKAPLPASVVKDFETWVKMGAPFPEAKAKAPAESKPSAMSKLTATHWSFQRVKNPPIPNVALRDWCIDPIDHFVLARLESKKLSPAADALPAVLIRRLYYDLIGLPPTIEKVNAFVADYEKHGRAAVERVVDALLASPQFGERWGRHWLDVARYGESNGNDGLSRNPTFPHAWRYRDYVIQAFNDDVPYDRFITEQIAGDLLPADSPEQRDRQLIATGFLAIGSKPAKAMNNNFDMDVVDDQINVVSSGVMGLSVACARCHDHKHDPIPTRDYYALAGIFKSTETLWGLAANEKLTAPATPLHELKSIAVVSNGKTESTAKKETPKTASVPKFAKGYVDAIEQLKPTLYASLAAKAPSLTLESSVKLSAVDRASLSGGRIRGQLKHAHNAYTVSFWFRNDTANNARPVTAYLFSRGPNGDKNAPGDHIGISGTYSKTGQGNLFAFNGNAKGQVLAGKTVIPPRTWNHVVFVREGNRVTAYLNGAAKPEFVGEIERVSPEAKEFFIGARNDNFSPLAGNVAEFALIDRALTADEAQALHHASGQPKGSGKQQPVVKSAAKPKGPLAMGVRDRAKTGDCKINIKGESNKLGPVVPRGFLTGCASDLTHVSVNTKQSGRLELAQWLMRGEHPQTSRVMVNRIWLHLFGQAIVATPDDFGIYGAQPSHPQMLDHLATRFVNEGWSIKRMIRAIVLSRTYQLASRVDERSRQADPDNALFGRHLRRRLDAESLRDSVLSASGRLDLTPGKGSIIQDMDVLVNQSGSLHKPSNHRSVYLCMLRNSPPPELAAFDLPNGVGVKGKRDITTLPAQSLFLLNNPFIVEQSKYLALQVQSQSSSDKVDDRVSVNWLYRRVFARKPASFEVDGAVQLVTATFKSLDPGSGDEQQRRLRSWASLCQALLATNEFRFVD